MKAVAFKEFGPPDVLEVEEVKKPIPTATEVLIKIHATTVTAADCMMRRGDTFMSRLVLGFFKPRRRYRVTGLELAGEIESVGKDVTRFKPGDRVFGFTGFSVGAHAQYICLPEYSSLAIMPGCSSYREAASMVDGTTTALNFLQHRAELKPNHRVLVIGASGSIGTAAVQLAHHFGANVTAVCSGRNVKWVRALGATRVIDYQREDFAKCGEKFDVILDAVGKSSFERCKGLLVDRGRYLTTVGGPVAYLRAFVSKLLGGKRFVFGMSVEKKDSLEQVRRLVEKGRLKPVIDRCYSLEEIVEAHRYVDKGHKRGNVLIDVAHSNCSVAALPAGPGGVL